MTLTRDVVLAEAKRLFGDNAILRRKGNQYQVARATPCDQIQILGQGNSMASALSDAATFMGVIRTENSDGRRAS